MKSALTHSLPYHSFHIHSILLTFIFSPLRAWSFQTIKSTPFTFVIHTASPCHLRLHRPGE